MATSMIKTVMNNDSEIRTIIVVIRERTKGTVSRVMDRGIMAAIMNQVVQVGMEVLLTRIGEVPTGVRDQTGGVGVVPIKVTGIMRE